MGNPWRVKRRRHYLTRNGEVHNLKKNMFKDLPGTVNISSREN